MKTQLAVAKPKLPKATKAALLALQRGHKGGGAARGKLGAAGPRKPPMQKVVRVVSRACILTAGERLSSSDNP